MKAAALIVVVMLCGCATDTFPARADERAQRSAELASMQRRSSVRPSWERANRRISSVKSGAPTSTARGRAPTPRGGAKRGGAKR